MKTTVHLIAFLLLAPVAVAQHQVEFVAARTSWTDAEFVGHAFMVVSTRVGNGSKEDAFGFYPRTADHTTAEIGGPTGVVESEFTKNPARFSRITVSMKRPITEAQRRAIIETVNDFNRRNYHLTEQSCIDFVSTTAKNLGWNIPPRDRSDLPATYLAKLKAANEPLLGTWTWLPRDQIVTIKPDGTVISTYKVTGFWKVLNEVQRTYEIRWSSGKFIDTLTLSEDGNSLTGSNQNARHPDAFLRQK